MFNDSENEKLWLETEHKNLIVPLTSKSSIEGLFQVKYLDYVRGRGTAAG